MGAMQDKILAQLGEAAEARGLEFNVQPDWPNTGLAFVQRRLETVATVRYNFQASYAGITVSGPAVGESAEARAHHRFETDRREGPRLWWPYLEYSKADGIKDMLAMFAVVLGPELETDPAIRLVEQASDNLFHRVRAAAGSPEQEALMAAYNALGTALDTLHAALQ
jgi:hypothetical protein